MKSCRYARRVEGLNTLLHWQFGIAEQGLLRVKHGVCFGDPVPHTGFRTSPIVQPRSQCLHTFHHTPNPTYATTTDNFNSITRFVFRERPSNNGRTLFFPSHTQALNLVGLCPQECVSCGSFCLPLRTNHPPSINDGALDPLSFPTSPDKPRRLFLALR